MTVQSNGEGQPSRDVPTNSAAQTRAAETRVDETPAAGVETRAAQAADDAATTNGAATNGQLSARAVPEAAVARLAVYLRVLSSVLDEGTTTISSEELAGAAGVNSAKLRKDLSYVGSYGTRGVGYDVEALIGHIERLLGLTQHHRIAVVGIGNLGHALANYPGFPGRGFPVAALFDVDPDLMGVPIGGIPVSHINDIPEVCRERGVTIAAICTPAAPAQEVADLLVAGGVRAVLNFAPVVLQVPDDVEVRKMDLAVEMQILSFHVARRSDGSDDGAVGDIDGLVVGQ